MVKFFYARVLEIRLREVSAWVGRGFKKKKGAAVRGGDGWNGDVASLVQMDELSEVLGRAR